MKRRRLSDLYVRGREVVFEEGEEDPVVVWLQKLNPIDRESCLRRAHAARARALLDADDEDGDLYQSIYGQIRLVSDKKALIGLIIAEEIARYRQRIEAEMAFDEESWGKERYLQGLVDSWIGDGTNPGLAAVKEQDPDDPEVKRVSAELDRFEEEVIGLVRAEDARLAAEWEQAPEDELWQRATKRMIEMRANDAFSNEFERQQLFYSVRDPDDHSKRYFGTLQEYDDIGDEVRQRLTSEYSNLTVETVEGKDSRASHSSSNSSDLSPAEEAQPDSGLQAVSA
jgi:hypothetical protein